MWAARFWANRYFAPFYWSKIGLTPVAGIYSRRPVQRSAGARSNWRKIIVWGG